MEQQWNLNCEKEEREERRRRRRQFSPLFRPNPTFFPFFFFTPAEVFPFSSPGKKWSCPGREKEERGERRLFFFPPPFDPRKAGTKINTSPFRAAAAVSEFVMGLVRTRERERPAKATIAKGVFVLQTPHSICKQGAFKKA